MGGFSSVELHVTRCSGSYRRAWAQGVFRKMQRSLDSWTEDLNRLRWSRVTKLTAATVIKITEDDDLRPQSLSKDSQSFENLIYQRPPPISPY